MLVVVVGDEEKEVQEFLSSTPVKSVGGTSYMPNSLKFPVESPLKRSFGVAFVTSEDEELMFRVKQSGKKEEN